MAKSVVGRVRAQYERFPYPEPEERLTDNFFNGTGTIQGCPKSEFPLYWPTQKKRDDLDILVTGCGSSQAATLGAIQPEARIVAIDISATSLDHSRALARKHGMTNVTHIQKSLYDVGDLGQSFDLIISSGVIHHLPDPAAGLRALRQVLRPLGSMWIMVYGRYGRAGVYLFQEMFRRLGFAPETVTPEEIHQIIDLTQNAPPTHPINLVPLFCAPQSQVEAVDRYLHPRDVAYTVPEVYDLVEGNGLVLQGWYHRANYSPRCTALVDHPFYDRIERLPERERFAIGELYRSTLYKHMFVACRDDRPRSTYEISFDGDKFLALVPQFRAGFIVGARKDGQPGGEGRLDGHYFDELSIKFDPTQSHVLSLIDGRRSIKDLVNIFQYSGDTATVRTYLRGFIKDLWEFDFVYLKFPE